MAPKPKKLGHGKSVLIRHPVASDAAEWCELWDRSERFLRPWFPRPKNKAAGLAPERFDRMLETTDTQDTQRHLLCRVTDGRIVGMVNLSQIFRGPFCNAVIGYWVGETDAGKGYTAEGVRLVLARAFGELGLHRVEANIMPTNTPSLALARSVGFREEGYSPRYLKIAGRWQDHVRFAMTTEVWGKLCGRKTQPK